MSESNGRRWGRVTVEGWIEQGQNMRWTEVWSERKGGRQVMATALDALTPTVEFLPEPVTFKDGDALCYSLVPRVYFRVNGEWLGTGTGDRWPDAAMVRDFNAGYCTRLVPEANGD